MSPDDTRPDIPVPLVMPADEFAAVRTVAEACGPVIDAGGSVPDDTGREPATAVGQPEGRVERDAATARTLISGALLAELGRRVYEYENAITWNTDCTSCARVLDSATAERERAERAEAELEHAKAALAGDNEGIRLWMLDCNTVAAKRLIRAERAEATLAEARAVLLEGGQGDATARCRAIAIIGTEATP